MRIYLYTIIVGMEYRTSTGVITTKSYLPQVASRITLNNVALTWYLWHITAKVYLN